MTTMNTLRGRGQEHRGKAIEHCLGVGASLARHAPAAREAANSARATGRTTGPDALPDRPAARRAAATAARPRIAATVVFGGDLIALGAAMLVVTRPADGANAIYALLAMVALLASGAYRLRISLSALDEAPRLATVLAVPLLLLAPFANPTQSRLLWQAVVLGRRSSSRCARSATHCCAAPVAAACARRRSSPAPVTSASSSRTSSSCTPSTASSSPASSARRIPGLPRPLARRRRRPRPHRRRARHQARARRVRSDARSRARRCVAHRGAARRRSARRAALLRSRRRATRSRRRRPVGHPDLPHAPGRVARRVWRFKRAVDIVLSIDPARSITAPVMAISALAVQVRQPRVRCCSVSAASVSTARRSRC